jgi:hypothetical protein
MKTSHLKEVTKPNLEGSQNIKFRSLLDHGELIKRNKKKMQMIEISCIIEQRNTSSYSSLSILTLKTKPVKLVILLLGVTTD